MSNQNKYQYTLQVNLRTFIRNHVPDNHMLLFGNELREWDSSFTTIANASTYEEGLLWILLDQAKQRFKTGTK